MSHPGPFVTRPKESRDQRGPMKIFANPRDVMIPKSRDIIDENGLVPKRSPVVTDTTTPQEGRESKRGAGVLHQL